MQKVSREARACDYGIGSVNSPCMWSSVRCQAPNDPRIHDGGREGGGEYR